MRDMTVGRNAPDRQSIFWLKFPLFVKWFITGKCNLRCSHCFLTDYTRQPDLQKILLFTDHFAERKVQAITLLGGEPLVRDDLEKIVAHINTRGIKTRIATNGMLVTKDRAHDLVAAGNTEFQVSLESGDAAINDSIRGADSFPESVRGIKHLKSAGASVTVGLTLSKANFDSFESMVPVAEALGVDTLRFEVFLPVGTGELNRERYLLTPDQLGFLKTRMVELQANASIHIVSPFGRTGCDTCSTLGCGAGTSNLILNSDFTVSACDLLVESDRTNTPIERPEELDALWIKHPLFAKWRGEQPRSALGDFTDVHQNEQCWIARTVYGTF